MNEPSIRFRPLARADFAELGGWLQEPHVARWWNEDASPGGVEAKYGPRVDGLEPTRMWVVEVDGGSAGLIQSYRHFDYPDHDAAVGVADAVGIDYFLAGTHAGRGLASGTIAAFAELVFDLYPDAEWCVATPAQDNHRSWRALERAGFERCGTCQPPNEPPAFRYKIGRR